MRLFDQIARDDFTSAEYAEPIFSYLNRTARLEFDKIRNELEDWFSRYPDSEKLELRGQFRSDINSQHQGAFFELLLHEMLLKMGCKVEIHPTIKYITNVPDFLIHPPHGDSFYLEATIATNLSKEEVSEIARINDVYDTLNRAVNSPNFFLWIKVDGAPKTPPPAKKLANFLNQQLANLDPDKIGELIEKKEFDSIPRWSFNHDGWAVEIEPTPKSPKLRGKPGIRPIGAQSTGIQQVNYTKPIRDSIIEKAGRYGEIDLPYIIAVNILEYSDEVNIMEALFGTEQYLIDFATDADVPPKMSRKPDGVWRGNDGPKYTRVSGALLFRRLSFWNIPSANPCLYHNPWAQKPYKSILTQLPQAIAINNNMKHIEGKSLNDILKLPSSWASES